MNIETLPNKKVDVSDVSTVSLRDIYMRLCLCRDFEIKLQWERAVFLTAFLIACFAGYGSFLLSVHQHGVGFLSPTVVKVIPLMITLIGIVLSVFWILMAKGSKSWYEHYEQAIVAFASNYHGAIDENLMAHNWIAIPGIKAKKMSNSILTLYGGVYSVSKIVIAIGICSFAIWSALFLVHLSITLWGPVGGWTCANALGCRSVVKIIVYVLGLMIVIVGIPHVLCKALKSTYLESVKGLP